MSSLFIYSGGPPDIETMERQWVSFLADPEWIDIGKQTDAKSGEPVVKATSRVLEAVD